MGVRGDRGGGMDEIGDEDEGIHLMNHYAVLGKLI